MRGRRRSRGVPADAARHLGLAQLARPPRCTARGRHTALFPGAPTRLTHSYVLAELAPLCRCEAFHGPARSPSFPTAALNWTCPLRSLPAKLREQCHRCRKDPRGVAGTGAAAKACKAAQSAAVTSPEDASLHRAACRSGRPGAANGDALIWSAVFLLLTTCRRRRYGQWRRRRSASAVRVPALLSHWHSRLICSSTVAFTCGSFRAASSNTLSKDSMCFLTTGSSRNTRVRSKPDAA
jgi:hypothetical protein